MSDKIIPVKVALRIRPLNTRERADGCSECVRTLGDIPQVILGKDKSFTYDFVFSQSTPQIEVYETAVQPLLNALFKGYNTTVLAYGQTGSGKTHTMGSAASLGYDCDNAGVIPRVLNDLFQRIEDEKFIQKDTKFTVKVSFVEIYNEDIKDLLNARQTEPLNIREENNSIKVVNLSEITVNGASMTKELLEKGSSLRVVGGTAMNEQSSRSHAIFTISLEQLNESDNNNLIKSKFHLVDLAGSERQSKTKAEGVRLKEGININLGLLALGNVISVLGEDNPNNKTKHVPYRESKLTRLLQDSLGGNSHTLMIACCSPADSNMEETLNTLRYADRARKIKNKPIVNIDPLAAELASLRQQVQEYKTQIFKLTGGTLPLNGHITNENITELNEIKEELEKYKLENHKLASELQRLIHSNRNTYEKLAQMESDKEAVEKKFEEMKELFESMKNEIKTSTNINQDTIADFEQKFSEIKEISINKNEDSVSNNEDLNDENALVDKDYALRQAQLQIQLSEYDNELQKKQMLHQRMLESTSQYGGFNYQASVDELKHKVEALEREKEELIDQMRQGENSKKVDQQRRERLKALESEVLELKKKEREFSKMQKLKEENEKNCEKLKHEIAHIKQERVKLMKQMKAETQAFRQYKQQKEKEVNQLKALERKRQVEISKLQVDNNKQEAMLKRKNEEIARTHKQLKELLDKKRLVAEKRQMQFDKKDSSAESERLRQWITQEIEMNASIAEARNSLTKLMEERRRLNAEIEELEDKLANEYYTSDEPPNKLNKKGVDLDSTYVTGSSTTNAIPVIDADDYSQRKQCLKQKIEALKYEKECKTSMIDDLNQMVIEADQNEDRTKNLFSMIHGVSETKTLLRHLFVTSTNYLLEYRQKQIELENLINSAAHETKDLKESLQQTQHECEKLKKHYTNEIDNLTNHYEQRIIACLRTNLSDSTYLYDDKIRSMAEQLQLLEAKFERKNESSASGFAVPKLNDMTNIDDQKKSLKLKREARRTRVIRTTKLDAIPNIDTIEESPQAPYSPSDNKDADPDWVKTPIRIRRENRAVKKMKQNLRSSKSSSEIVKKENTEPDE